MHSYDGHENKVGVDDLIFQNGPDKIIQILKGAYLSAAYNLEELLSYLENSQLPVRKRITSCLLAIYRLRSIEQEAVLNYIKDNFSITKETLRKELEEIKKQLKKTRMKKPKNGSCPLHSNETQEPQYKNIVKEVLCRSSIYKMGTSVLAISDVKKEIDEKNFPAYLLEQGIEIYKELESGLIYFSLNSAQARVCLNFLKNDPAVKEIRAFTELPMFDENWELTERGYNKDGQIYQMGEPLDPIQSTTYLYKMIRGFAFKNQASKANYIGFLLTTLLRSHYVGSKPMIVATGNQRGLGKTTSVALAQIIFEGGSRELQMPKSEEELQKGLVTVLRERDIVFYDNVSSDREIDSPVLASVITAEEPAFRLLGANDPYSRKNTFIIILSVNGGRLAEDFISRSMAIEFYLNREMSPEERDFEILDIREWTKKNRNEIYAELLGMVEVWKQKGKPLDRSLKTRFPKWAMQIGGILKANGIEGFLENKEIVANLFSDEAKQIGVLFEEHLGEKLKADILVDIGKSRGVFSDICYAEDQAAAKLGKVLKAYGDKDIPLEDGRVFLLHIEKDRAQNSNIYTAKLKEESCGDTGDKSVSNVSGEEKDSKPHPSFLVEKNTLSLPPHPQYSGSEFSLEGLEDE